MTLDITAAGRFPFAGHWSQLVAGGSTKVLQPSSQLSKAPFRKICWDSLRSQTLSSFFLRGRTLKAAFLGTGEEDVFPSS